MALKSIDADFLNADDNEYIDSESKVTVQSFHLTVKFPNAIRFFIVSYPLFSKYINISGQYRPNDNKK